ncbi:hypothetical protein ABZT02_41635 [Streptomyces sp. NPDC005402]|uniref:hypothetical protein n=1 Tax=Streptomyces sp. NPDC005402 TaxID=3155338 RepID=UPI0033AEA841
MLLSDFDVVRGAGELPAVGAFADDVVDEVVLELVVGEFAGESEFLDLVPVPRLPSIRRGSAAAALLVPHTTTVDGLDAGNPSALASSEGSSAGCCDLRSTHIPVEPGVGQPARSNLSAEDQR